MKKKWKLYVAAFLTVVMGLTFINPKMIMAETSAKAQIFYSGTWDYEKAYDIFELTNNKRLEEGEQPLELDASLMEIAMRRAQEISVYYGHDRPDGKLGFPENLASGTSNAIEAFEGWVMSEDHRHNILKSEHKSMGIGVFTQNGRDYYYIQVFSYKESDTIDDKNKTNKDNKIRMMMYPEHLKLSFVAENNETISMLTGDTLETNLQTYSWEAKNYYFTNYTTTLLPTSFTFESSNEKVVRYNKNTGLIEAVGSGDATITAKLENYTDEYGYLTKTFHVEVPVESINLTPKELELYIGESQQLHASVVPDNAPYTWHSVSPYNVSVDDTGKIMAHNAGKTTITVSGKNTNGVVRDNCTVTVYQDFSTLNLTGIEDLTYDPTESEYTQYVNNIVVKDGEKQISAANYDISYLNNTGVGEATIILTGKGNFKGSIEKTFQILPLSLTHNDIKVNDIPSMPYTGEPITVPLELTHNYSTTLEEGTDYDVSYSNNTNPGLAKIEITGKGNYKGTITRNFYITKEDEDCNHVSKEWTVIKEATCTEEGIREEHCTMCGQLFRTEKIPATGHEGAWEVTKEATCREPGEKNEICTKCKEVLDTEEIPVVEHKGSWIVVKEATCTEPGTKEERCIWCNELLETEEIPATGHKGAWTITKESTCIETGTKEERCTWCNEVLATEEIPVTGHKGSWSVTKEATCTEPGSKEEKCTLCKEVLKTETIPAQGHNGKWNTTKEATCTVAGKKEERCTRCNTLLNSESIAATGHQNSGWRTTKEATCTTKGEKQVVCKKCGTVLEKASIGAFGHHYSQWTTSKEPGYGETGQRIRTCSRCGRAETQDIAALVGNWVANETGWWYQTEDGSYPVSEWTRINGSWYYFDGNGYMANGWQLINHNWYYLHESGAMATGWTMLDGSWYYLSESGAMQSGWYQVGDSWYYSNASGAMQTGWQSINNSWYYLHGNGAMATGWNLLDGSWYYLSESGAMQTGWYQVGNNWYYSNASGVMQTGWVGNYYLLNNGAMAVNMWTPDGYWVDKNGAWVPGA